MLTKNYKMDQTSKGKIRYVTFAKHNDGIFSLNETKTLATMIARDFEAKKNKKIKVVIRGSTILGDRTLETVDMEHFTIKGYEELIEDMYDDEEQYAKGRAKDDTKYKDVHRLTFAILV